MIIRTAWAALVCGLLATGGAPAQEPPNLFHGRWCSKPVRDDKVYKAEVYAMFDIGAQGALSFQVFGFYRDDKGGVSPVRVLNASGTFAMQGDYLLGTLPSLNSTVVMKIINRSVILVEWHRGEDMTHTFYYLVQPDGTVKMGPAPKRSATPLPPPLP